MVHDQTTHHADATDDSGVRDDGCAPVLRIAPPAAQTARLRLIPIPALALLAVITGAATPSEAAGLLTLGIVATLVSDDGRRGGRSS